MIATILWNLKTWQGVLFFGWYDWATISNLVIFYSWCCKMSLELIRRLTGKADSCYCSQMQSVIQNFLLSCHVNNYVFNSSSKKTSRMLLFKEANLLLPGLTGTLMCNVQSIDFPSSLRISYWGTICPVFYLAWWLFPLTQCHAALRS
jgi:hypothetical protein